MPFPEFDFGGRKVLWFSRGRGRGHAIPDIRIAQELQSLAPDVQIRFVSYATGARTFQEREVPVIDLGLPAANGAVETTVLAGRLIGWLQPDLVIAHEEFAAMPAASIFQRPAVMLTDWFSEADTFAMASLKFAQVILFLDDPGIHSVPEFLRGKVRYLGPQVRSFGYTRDDRARARRELGIAPGAIVIGVFPGSWTEDRAPIAERVIAAFDALPSPKHLLWLAGTDQALISRRLDSRENVTVADRDWTIDRWFSACDLAITKVNRKTVVELAALGIRTISISYGLNPIDELRAGTLASNVTVSAQEFGPELLQRQLREPEPEPAQWQAHGDPARELAGLLLSLGAKS